MKYSQWHWTNEKNIPEYFECATTCFQCQKAVTRILSLEKTNAHLCSLECESKYWLNIFH